MDVRCIHLVVEDAFGSVLCVVVLPEDARANGGSGILERGRETQRTIITDCQVLYLSVFFIGSDVDSVVVR